MADLKATEDLSRHFAHYPDMAELIAKLGRLCSEISDYNKAAAGTDDDTGKQYHESVNPGTKQLTDTMTQVSSVVMSIGQTGKDTADGLQAASDNATDLVKGM